MSIFSWTVPIQFLPKSGKFPPLEIIIVIVIIELWYLIDFCLELFYIKLMPKTVLFYDTLFPYQIQMGMTELSVGGSVGGGGSMTKESIHFSIIQSI